MRKVLIPTKLDAIARELLTANDRFEVVQDDQGDVKGLVARHPDAFAIIVRSEKVTPAVMDALPQLKVVIRAGAGYDNIDTKYARARGIDVMNTPGANANAVAEEVLALMLADARHIPAADASTRAGQWEKNRFMGREITGKTVGVVGLGNIGRLVARRLAGFEVRLLGYDPLISADRAAEHAVELTDLPALFARSDYITLHMPENDGTRRMINASLLGRMKPGATLINCARAGIVDEEAVRAVRKEKKIRFLNDVYEKDSEGPKSVADIADIMMPHLGASTAEANRNAARRAAEELIEFTEKGVTSYIVNRDIPEGLDETYCTLANTLARLGKALLGPDAALKSIETSVYGPLQPYADWLIVPMVAGLWKGFEVSLDDRAARDYLKDMGVSYTRREVDPGKPYGPAITIDLIAAVGGDNLRTVSLRGTATEGHLIVSRVNEFDKLYFEPRGHTVFFLYDDRPGVVGAIGIGLADAGVNIEDIRQPHNATTRRSLAIVKVDKPVSADVIRAIATGIVARSAFYIEL